MLLLLLLLHRFRGAGSEHRCFETDNTLGEVGQSDSPTGIKITSVGRTIALHHWPQVQRERVPGLRKPVANTANEMPDLTRVHSRRDPGQALDNRLWSDPCHHAKGWLR